MKYRQERLREATSKAVAAPAAFASRSAHSLRSASSRITLLYSKFNSRWAMKRARMLRLGYSDIGRQPYMTRSESGLSRAIAELDADLQALVRFRQPATKTPAATSCAMMAFSHKRKHEDEDSETSSNGKLPAVDTANMLEWRRAVTTKLAVINKTGITLPLYTVEPVIDAVLEATLRSAGYIIGGAHAVMPIEEAILHNGTAKGKEVLKKRVEERDTWRLQNNQIFHHVQIACQADGEISRFVKDRIDGTALADRGRMDGRQLLDDICANFHRNTPATINVRVSVLHSSILKPGQSATDFCVDLETEARSLVIAGVVLDVEQTCLQLLQQALSKSDKYRQFAITLFLRTGVDAAITWNAVKNVIRAWDINHRSSTSSHQDRNFSTSSSDSQARYQLRMGGMERTRQKGRKLYRRDGRAFELTKSALPPRREASNFYSANGPPRHESSSERRPPAKKPYGGPPGKYKYQRPKSMAVYQPRTIKCFKCGGDHMMKVCPQNRDFKKSSVNLFAAECSSSDCLPNLTADDDDEDERPVIASFILKSTPSMGDDGSESELEDGEIRDIDLDYDLFPSLSSQSAIDVEVPPTLSSDDESIDFRSAILKRKFSAEPDLFASDDDDDEVARINITSSSRFDESYSPVAPSCSPMNVSFYFEAQSNVSTPTAFDTSKLIDQSELSPAYQLVIEADLACIEDRVQLAYFDEFIQLSADMDFRDEVDLLLQYHELAAADIGMNTLKTRQAISLARAHHYEQRHSDSTPTVQPVSTNASFSEEYLCLAYKDYRSMARAAASRSWLDGIDAYAPEGEHETVFLHSLMFAAGSRLSIPSQRIDQVLRLFADATPAERSIVWRAYDAFNFRIPRLDDQVDMDAIELHRESGVLTREGKCDWKCKPAESNLHGCACLPKARSHSLEVYRQVLRCRVDVDVFCYKANSDYLNNLEYLCIQEFQHTLVFRDRLLQSIECARSRGYMGKFCCKCINGQCGVGCSRFMMKAEGEPLVLKRPRDDDDPDDASSASVGYSTRRLRRYRVKPAVALDAESSSKFDIYFIVI